MKKLKEITKNLVKSCKKHHATVYIDREGCRIHIKGVLHK